MKIAVLGYGREGWAVLKFLRQLPKYDFAQFWALDKNSKISVPRGARRQTGRNYLKNLSQFQYIFRSPGIPYLLPEIQEAIKNGAVLGSATKLFFEHCPARIIGVTGTKGKGTTATLIYKILKHAGFGVHLVGNIGRTALQVLPKIKKHHWVVFELSSFQLQDLTVSPAAAVILDIFPDHLDSHQNFSEYLEAKTSISRYQTPKNLLFYFADNKNSRLTAQPGRAQKSAVSAKKFALFKPEILKIPGAHNFKNAVMAATICQKLGVPAEKIIQTVSGFTGLEHRLEFVREMNGVKFYNDSASTNPQTAAAAILSFKEPIILIAGGKDKNLDYQPLARALKKSKVKKVILFGENKNKIFKALANPSLIRANGRMVKNDRIKNDRIKIELASDLKAAVELAQTSAASKNIILFSPAAASFDMFDDYADRGRKFKGLVLALK